MKKILYIILFVINLFALSCNHNKSNFSSTNPIGKVGEITVDPYKVTPLSAVYITETVNAAPITVTVKGLYGEPDVIHTYPAGYGTEFEIHGMFPESQNTIEVNDGGRIITKNVNVGALSYNGVIVQKKYDVEINNLYEEKYPNNPELYFVTYYIQNVSLGISRNGYVRYISKLRFFYKVIPENNSINIYSRSGGVFNLLGKSIVNFPVLSEAMIPFHHDAIRKNNNYLFLSGSRWDNQDIIVETSGNNIVKTLNIGNLIEDIVLANNNKDEIEKLNKIVFNEGNIHTTTDGKQTVVDSFHLNSIVYDSSTDILYISSRHRGVLAVDYSEWKLIWWMADNTINTRVLENLGTVANTTIPHNVHLKDLPSLNPYRVMGDGATDGPKNQHALFLLANGNLGMFDNQGDEDTNPNGSRYVEYKITGTHGNYTAQKVYEYRNSSMYSRLRSDVDFTGDSYQNLLLCYADNSAGILEIEKGVKKELFKLNLNPEVYRADKMPLYYDEGRVYSEDCNLKNPN
ncbi:aryl-sulfate sulfotransferase [Brachyspira intermedia]|uniref:aryl-sulfate sulfotransferase n=1 Tax=Brachyspira intermedia TaxID=84377 RepID=UPI0030043EDA